MELLIQLEESLLFLGCLYLFSRLNLKWWWFPALLMLPDLGMLGYLINPVAGAVTYNLVHFKGVGIMISLYGLKTGSKNLMLAGIILLAHACMDRAIGAGLKYPDSFWHTNLGFKKFI
ncbi:MAG: DUF4260 family protein [Sphingobacteriaceae bacterium]|nr:MAG: DUF4260 family protein [Sphingobacteriaceae bacterium]